MAKRKTVWIVTHGCYSDYSIGAVCSTEERATAVSSMFSEANKPFEMTIDEQYTPDKLGKKLYLCWCYQKDASIEPCQFNPTWDVQEIESKDGHALRLWIWADSEESAAKIANERRARWVAGADTYPKG